MNLTRVEAAFKAMKSHPSLRPVRHHEADQTQACLFVSVLAYHVLASIERALSLKGDTRSWPTIRKVLSPLQRSTVFLRRWMDTIHQIRLCGTPEDAK
jgi:hypothetical protein